MPTTHRPHTIVRIRSPHPLAGMTGTVVSANGSAVTVHLTAWGSSRTFDQTDLIDESDMTPGARAERIKRFRDRLRAAVREDAA